MEIALRPLDVVALVLYLLGMAAMGVYFARRNKNTEEYFVGGRSLPGWAVGISMLGTGISSVTFLAFPADAFQVDWRRLVPNLTLPLVAVLAVIVFIPFFRRGGLTSAFEYLGDRYGPGARLYGSFSFALFSLIRIAKILFLVSIPISLLTGAPLTLVIVCVGVFIAFYTIVGGIDAVIWTDVIQTFVLWGGGVLVVGYTVWHLPGGLGEVFTVGAANGKFGLGDTNFDLTTKTVWVLIFLGLFNWLAVYGTDQTMVQRYAAARSEHEARKATILFSLLAVPTWTFFFLVGTCLFAFYRAFPDPTIAQLQADEVMPYFILTRIPAGIAGLVLAGVLAAAMSSLDSSINAISTLVVVDFLKTHLARGRDDRYYLLAARVIASLASVVMIAGAVVFTVVPMQSLNSLSWMIMSVFAGCMVGLFMLGFFSRRVDYVSAMMALGLAVLLNIYLGLGAMSLLPEAWSAPLDGYWVGPIVNLAFVLLAYGIALVRNRPPTNLRGLTVWDMGTKNMGVTPG